MATNRLAGETSPYLLQHAHNPVDWHPWGAEALERARVEDRPIFLSVGYAACHWCHVMERESFEDATTAACLNASFVSIKVDREERPDLDAIYMHAVQALTGSGGWPMSVFLTPDGRPFHGGTYFPNTRRHGLPSFLDVLEAVAGAWRERREDVERAATGLASRLAPTIRLSDGPAPANAAVLDAAVSSLESGFDAADGGWGLPMKFPQPMALEFLLRRAAWGDDRAVPLVRRTLDRMAAGGIHDQLGGGFNRYATEPTWLVPHFEKMLPDNGQLARVYVHAWQLTREPGYLDVARTTLDFVAREMTLPDGVFAASLDADTDGEEGATYTWTAGEVRDSLIAAGRGADVELFAAAYDVTAGGNWEGRTILRRIAPDAELAARTGLAEAEVRARLADDRGALLAARDRRRQPARDDKALAGWNGLMLAAFADAATALAHEVDATLAEAGRRYREIAERAAERLVAVLPDECGRLRRSWKDGQARHAGTLEDHACLADGLLALHEATANERWFSAARDLAETILAHFVDPDGGFFDTADDAERLVARPRSLEDNALPSGNAMAALVLLRLAALTGDGRYSDAAELALGLVGTAPARYPTAFAQWLQALDWRVGPVDEIALVGAPDDPRLGRLLEVARAGFRPRQVVAVAADPASSVVPLLQARFALGGLPTAFVCRGFACRQPVTEPEALAALLAG
jgi:uncharacterized protein YyaL (SSP411 family)